MIGSTCVHFLLNFCIFVLLTNRILGFLTDMFLVFGAILSPFPKRQELSLLLLHQYILASY